MAFVKIKLFPFFINNIFKLLVKNDLVLYAKKLYEFSGPFRVQTVRLFSVHNAVKK